MGALVAPPAIVLVSKPFPVWVEVWGMLSSFRQATFWPTLTFAGFGEYDMPPAIPTMAMTTSADPPPVVDGGVVVGVEL